MNRMTTVSTAIGLLGVMLAMLAAIGTAFTALILLGFTMMLLGAMGAVIGVASSMARAVQSSR